MKCGTIYLRSLCRIVYRKEEEDFRVIDLTLHGTPLHNRVEVDKNERSGGCCASRPGLQAAVPSHSAGLRELKPNLLQGRSAEVTGIATDHGITISYGILFVTPEYCFNKQA